MPKSAVRFKQKDENSYTNNQLIYCLYRTVYDVDYFLNDENYCLNKTCRFIYVFLCEYISHKDQLDFTGRPGHLNN